MAAGRRPEYLRAATMTRLRRLDVEAIDLLQLHRIDTKVPQEEQFGVLKEMQDEQGAPPWALQRLGHQIEERKVFDVATVQNGYNLADQTDEACSTTASASGFLAVVPARLGRAGKARRPRWRSRKGARRDPRPGLAASLLKRSPVMLPIPGATTVADLQENVAAADVTLTEDEFARLDGAGSAAAKSAARCASGT
jgi:aryl-alcohol dehydrogenase-like predicted oxidoreductase